MKWAAGLSKACTVYTYLYINTRMVIIVLLPYFLSPPGRFEICGLLNVGRPPPGNQGSTKTKITTMQNGKIMCGTCI